MDAILPNAGSLKRGFMRATSPVGRFLVRRDYGVSQASADEGLAGIRAAMDRVESELDGGDYLVGDAFSVADLAAASLFTPLLAPEGRPWAPKTLVPELRGVREELEARPGGAWVHRMYELHRGVPVAA